MCGIAGIFGDPREDRPPILRRMLHALRHRGPDGFGVYDEGAVGLAHARLSIVDLEGGAQPICNEDGSLWIVFNGEIFNHPELRADLERRGHRFRTGTDTEVILHLFEEVGEDVPGRLNGQFAFAIWDRARERLFLARDRFGICPLLYARSGGRFLFASEAKALLADPSLPRRLDPLALDDVFSFWFPLSPRTAFEGIRELPPAHVMSVTSDRSEIRRYWELPEGGDPPGLHGEEYYADRLQELLVDATRLRLRADVPVGAYLSGGLDSSLVAAIVRQRTDTPLRTFSVRFDDPAFDEGGKQEAMASFLGTRHRSFPCSEEDIGENFEGAVTHAEVPVVRTAPVPLFLLSEEVRRSGYKVVLTGEGADELFAGYDLFRETKVRRFVEADPGSAVRPLLLKRLYGYLPVSPVRFLRFAKAFFTAPTSPFGPLYASHAPRWNLTGQCRRFYSEGFAAALEGTDPARRVEAIFDDAARPGRLDWLTRAQEIETRTLLPGYLLSSQGDRMLMAHSVEGRFPYLDHRVAEFAFSVPPGMRLKGLVEKHVLRKCAERFLPPSTAREPKQPYRSPDVRSFLSGKGADLAADRLSTEALRESGIFDPRKVGALVSKCREGGAVGFRDNMAFVAILSTQILHHRFVCKGDGGESVPDGEVRRRRFEGPPP